MRWRAGHDVSSPRRYLAHNVDMSLVHSLGSVEIDEFYFMPNSRHKFKTGSNARHSAPRHLEGSTASPLTGTTK